MLIHYLYGEVKCAIVYVSLEFREEVWVGDTNLGEVISM